MSDFSIGIPGFPSDYLTPGFYFGIDDSNANTAQARKVALLIGQQNTASILGFVAPPALGYPPGVPVLAGSVSEVQRRAGNGSHLALMYAAFRAVDDTTEVWLLPLNDDPGMVATRTIIRVAGSAQESGTIFLRIAGQLVQVAVNNGDSRQVIGTNLVAAIKAAVDLPVYVDAQSDSPTDGIWRIGCVSKNKGDTGNDVFYSVASKAGESTPKGVSIGFAGAVVDAGVVGTGYATQLPTILATLPEKSFDFIGCVYNDQFALNALQAFLDDQTGRWSGRKQLFGHVFYAYRGSVAQRQTFGSTRNNKHESCIGFNGSESPHWAWGASLCGAAAKSANEDPALPIREFTFAVDPPASSSQDDRDDRDTLLHAGISTYKVSDAGEVRVDKVVTTYTQDPDTGAPTNAYRNAETLNLLRASISDFGVFIQSRCSRKTLVQNGSVLRGGSNRVTPQSILALAITRYRTQCTDFGWCQDPETFAKKARAIIAAKGQVRLLLPITLADQLDIIAVNFQFS